MDLAKEGKQETFNLQDLTIIKANLSSDPLRGSKCQL